MPEFASPRVGGKCVVTAMFIIPVGRCSPSQLRELCASTGGNLLERVSGVCYGKLTRYAMLPGCVCLSVECGYNLGYFLSAGGATCARFCARVLEETYGLFGETGGGRK